MVTEANSINAATTGIVGNTGTAFTGTAVTQYNILTGASTSSTLNNVAPSSTSGVPLISQGSSAQPLFGTCVVGGGGTGLTSATSYAVLCGGTTTTGAFQSIAGVGTTGQVLTSNGASALPTFQAAGTGNLVLIQSQTASGSSSLTFTTGISATYNNYLLVYSRYLPSSGSAFLELQVSTNGGSSYVATGYTSGENFNGYNQLPASNANSTTYFVLFNNGGATSGQTTAGYVFLLDITSGDYSKMVGQGNRADGGYQTLFGACSTGGINALKISTSTGTFGGIFTLFGILE